MSLATDTTSSIALREPSLIKLLLGYLNQLSHVSSTEATEIYIETSPMFKSYFKFTIALQGNTRLSEVKYIDSEYFLTALSLYLTKNP